MSINTHKCKEYKVLKLMRNKFQFKHCTTKLGLRIGLELLDNTDILHNNDILHFINLYAFHTVTREDNIFYIHSDNMTSCIKLELDLTLNIDKIYELIQKCVNLYDTEKNNEYLHDRDMISTNFISGIINREQRQENSELQFFTGTFNSDGRINITIKTMPPYGNINIDVAKTLERPIAYNS